ncbi:hypothetical protein TrLO_g11950 [Triparma laevis f. longispina]|uniref:Autophagy-related protein 6 n=1 Tax=Triparma laevis f. longispina TaxID=1714387 RepID=A0A9W7KY99_9STRA|nr:hypothetical protein TrLO_g11950 [Triparma laevis f. longispina]
MSATSPLQCCYCNSALPPNDLADSSLQNAPISASTSFVSSPSPLPNPEMSYISIPTSTATSTSIRPFPNSPTNSFLKSTLTSIPLPSNIRAQKLYVDELLKLSLSTSSKSCCGMCLRSVEEAISSNNDRLTSSINLLKNLKPSPPPPPNFNSSSILLEITELKTKLKMYDSEYENLKQLDEEIFKKEREGEVGEACERIKEIELNSERFKGLTEEVLQKNNSASSLVTSLRSYSVISKMYSIKFPPNSPPSINGLKLTASPPNLTVGSTLTSYLHRTSQPITWSEISGAWTSVCKLIKNISNLVQFPEERVFLIIGTTSLPSRVGYLPRGKKQRQYMYLGRLEEGKEGNINPGLSLLIHYLHTLWVYVQGCKANAGGKLMPFVMGEDRIGGIRLSLCGGREDWEKVVEGVARNLEFLKTHVHTFV